jgi:alkylation response protein AidB-like acyl-CoA dehydrogenase
MAGGALKVAATAAQKERYLAGVIDGSTQGALAYAEPQGRFNLADLTTQAAAADSGGWLLNGYKAVVLNGPSADFLIVSARTSGDQRDVDGVSLFVVPANADGISRRDYPTVDAFRASEITFDSVALPAESLLGAAGEGLGVIEQVIDEAILAVGAEAVGCMEVLYKATVEYCKTREQFGQPIGKFQVLQHRMVDMFMEHEQAKSLMFMAAMRMAEGYGDEAKKAVSAFKVQVGKSGRFVGQSAVQLHGGMGMTEELSIGHYFKRLTMIDTLFGNVDFHLKRFGAL